MTSIKEVFDEFVKATGKNTDYIYTPQGNVRPLLVKELLAENIPFTNVNGYLLIQSKDIEAVRGINKELLEEKTHFYKETSPQELRSQLLASNIKSLDAYTMDQVSLYDFNSLRETIGGVSQLMMCTEMNENNTYKMSVPKDKMFGRKGKNLAQALLESSLRDRLTNQKTKISNFEKDLRVKNYISTTTTSSKDYHITSEIDPSLFITVSKDGFSLNHWQVTKNGLNRVTDARHSVAEEDYLERFYQALSLFPDLKIAKDNLELNDCLLRKHKPSISLKGIRMGRGIKKLAKRLNAMLLNAGPNVSYTLNAYLEEASRIINDTSKGISLSEYDEKDIESLKKILSRYGLEEELSVNQDLATNIPECYEEKIESEETKERSVERNANTNREGTI